MSIHSMVVSVHSRFKSMHSRVVSMRSRFVFMHSRVVSMHSRAVLAFMLCVSTHSRGCLRVQSAALTVILESESGLCLWGVVRAMATRDSTNSAWVL